MHTCRPQAASKIGLQSQAGLLIGRDKKVKFPADFLGNSQKLFWANFAEKQLVRTVDYMEIFWANLAGNWLVLH